MYEPKTIENDLEWLRQVSLNVDLENDDLDEMIDILDNYCLTHEVFAMAAIQLGINKRLVYLKNTDLDKVDEEDWNERTILINPVIVSREGLTSYWEACVSCLDNMGLVLRPYKIEVQYLDVNGEKKEMSFEGFPATVFSHEYDHLDGILHMDKALDLKIMTRDERIEFRKEHGYEVYNNVGDFETLESEYKKVYKRNESNNT